METEEDRAAEENRKPDDDAKLSFEETPFVPQDTDRGQENQGAPSHPVPMRAGPDLILDERLTSAAAPFLYMLAIALVAVAGYFVYMFFHG
jgi:hypothetical protein